LLQGESSYGKVTQVPVEIKAALKPIKDNEEAVRAYGIHLGTEMCKEILSHDIRTLHLYSLNLEKSVLGILQVLCNIFPDVILCDLSILVGGAILLCGICRVSWWGVMAASYCNS
jgi:hypothetical protein